MNLKNIQKGKFKRPKREVDVQACLSMGFESRTKIQDAKILLQQQRGRFHGSI